MYWDPKSVRGGERRIDRAPRRHSVQSRHAHDGSSAGRAEKRVTVGEFRSSPMAQRQYLAPEEAAEEEEEEEEDVNDTLDELANEQNAREHVRQERVTNSYG